MASVILGLDRDELDAWRSRGRKVRDVRGDVDFPGRLVVVKVRGNMRLPSPRARRVCDAVVIRRGIDAGSLISFFCGEWIGLLLLCEFQCVVFVSSVSVWRRER